MTLTSTETTTTTKVTKQPPKTPERRTAGQWAKGWEPDPRWFHPVVAALLLYAVGWIPKVWPVPPYWMALIGIAAVTAGVASARNAYPDWKYGRDHAGQLSRFAVFSGVAAGGWLVYAGYSTPVRAAGVLLLGTGVFGAAYAVIHSKGPKRAALVVEQQAREERRWLSGQWTDILGRAGLPGMQVLDIAETRAGYTLTVQVNPAAPVTFAEFRAKERAIAVNASMVFSRHGRSLRESDVRAEEARAAHLFLLHVSTKNVLVQSVPFPMDNPGGSINDPAEIGLYEDGQGTDLVLVGRHAMFVGCTGSGKTVLLNNLMARITERFDALVWVACTDKLVPLVYPWLRPWFDGRCEHPVIDWVAGQDPGEVLRMLAAGYRLMRERNASLANRSSHLATPREPAVVVIIDEASDALRRRDTIATHDGQRMNATQLVYQITRAGRSAEYPSSSPPAPPWSTCSGTTAPKSTGT